MDIKTLIDEAYRTAEEKGWWEPKVIPGTTYAIPVNVPEKLALMHSEISEALEEHRNNIPLGRIYADISKNEDPAIIDYTDETHPTHKPEGFIVELADVLIRICDLVGKYELPLEQALKYKLAYNKTRSFRHGNKTC